MNKSAFTLVAGLCLVGLSAWAGPSLWRAHHGSSGCCGMVSTDVETSCPKSACCEMSVATCEVKEGTCSAGSMVCTEAFSEMGVCELGCESAMPCTEPGEKFVQKMTIQVHSPRE